MIGDSLFIQLVDHRVSTALIFFLLMVLLNNRKPKQKFGLRALAAFAAMCAVSWTLRTVIDVGSAGAGVRRLYHRHEFDVSVWIFALLLYNAGRTAVYRLAGTDYRKDGVEFL